MLTEFIIKQSLIEVRIKLLAARRLLYKRHKLLCECQELLLRNEAFLDEDKVS